MRLKTFTAADMKEAMEIARDMMGDDAIIISSGANAGGGVQVTVALDEPEAYQEESAEETTALEDTYIYASPEEEVRPHFGSTEEESDEAADTPTASQAPFAAAQPVSAKNHALSDLEDILIYHGVPRKLVSKLLKRASTLHMSTAASIGETQSRITGLLDIYFQFDTALLDSVAHYMLIGPSGAGKTLTIAKMAARLVQEKRPCQVITADTKKAGSTEQLAAFTDILNLPLKVAESRAELRDMLKATPEGTTSLIDSFGANPYDFQEMKELGEFAGLQDIDPILTIPAGIHEGEAEEIARVYGFLNIEKMLVTRADCARRFGSILAASHAGDLALTYVSASPKVLGDFRPLDAIALGQMLVQCKRDNVNNLKDHFDG